MTKLDKKQLEYLSRTIMPELYKRQAQKDDYLEQLKSSLKEAKVKENNEVTYAEWEAIWERNQKEIHHRSLQPGEHGIHTTLSYSMIC